MQSILFDYHRLLFSTFFYIFLPSFKPFPTFYSFCSIAFEGRLLVIGFTSGEIPKIASNLLLVKSCSAMGVYWGSYSMREPAAFMESVNKSAEYLLQGKINPQISTTYPLNKVSSFLNIRYNEVGGKTLISNYQPFPL